MNVAAESLILAPNEGAAAEILNPGGSSRICLVCEHASPFIPASLKGLGLSEADRFSHAVWDIGARQMAVLMADALDATLVASRVSRLVYDCNRPPEARDAMPAQTEYVKIPGNEGLNFTERKARTDEVYRPFCRLLVDTLDSYPTPPVLVTIHSFTPTWYGKVRDVELGLLHDDDPRLAERMLGFADGSVRTALNKPYSAADGVTHTLKEHAVPRGIENVMIEVRNDLVSDAEGVTRMAGILCNMLDKALKEKEGGIG